MEGIKSKGGLILQGIMILVSYSRINGNQFTLRPKGQLNQEWTYDVILSPKMQTKKYKDFCPTKQGS